MLNYQHLALLALPSLLLAAPLPAQNNARDAQFDSILPLSSLTSLLSSGGKGGVGGGSLPFLSNGLPINGLPIVKRDPQFGNLIPLDSLTSILGSKGKESGEGKTGGGLPFVGDALPINGLPIAKRDAGDKGDDDKEEFFDYSKLLKYFDGKDSWVGGEGKGDHDGSHTVKATQVDPQENDPYMKSAEVDPDENEHKFGYPKGQENYPYRKSTEVDPKEGEHKSGYPKGQDCKYFDGKDSCVRYESDSSPKTETDPSMVKSTSGKPQFKNTPGEEKYGFHKDEGLEDPYMKSAEVDPKSADWKKPGDYGGGEYTSTTGTNSIEEKADFEIVAIVNWSACLPNLSCWTLVDGAEQVPFRTSSACENSRSISLRSCTKSAPTESPGW